MGSANLIENNLNTFKALIGKTNKSAEDLNEIAKWLELTDFEHYKTGYSDSDLATVENTIAEFKQIQEQFKTDNKSYLEEDSGYSISELLLKLRHRENSMLQRVEHSRIELSNPLEYDQFSLGLYDKDRAYLGRIEIANITADNGIDQRFIFKTPHEEENNLVSTSNTEAISLITGGLALFGTIAFGPLAVSASLVGLMAATNILSKAKPNSETTLYNQLTYLATITKPQILKNTGKPSTYSEYAKILNYPNDITAMHNKWCKDNSTAASVKTELEKIHAQNLKLRKTYLSQNTVSSLVLQELKAKFPKINLNNCNVVIQGELDSYDPMSIRIYDEYNNFKTTVICHEESEVHTHLAFKFNNTPPSVPYTTKAIKLTELLKKLDQHYELLQATNPTEKPELNLAKVKALLSTRKELSSFASDYATIITSAQTKQLQNKLNLPQVTNIPFSFLTSGQLKPEERYELAEALANDSSKEFQNAKFRVIKKHNAINPSEPSYVLLEYETSNIVIAQAHEITENAIEQYNPSSSRNIRWSETNSNEPSTIHLLKATSIGYIHYSLAASDIQWQHNTKTQANPISTAEKNQNFSKQTKEILTRPLSEFLLLLQIGACHEDNADFSHIDQRYQIIHKDKYYALVELNPTTGKFEKQIALFQQIHNRTHLDGTPICHLLDYDENGIKKAIDITAGDIEPARLSSYLPLTVYASEITHNRPMRDTTSLDQIHQALRQKDSAFIPALDTVERAYELRWELLNKNYFLQSEQRYFTNTIKALQQQQEQFTAKLTAITPSVTTKKYKEYSVLIQQLGTAEHKLQTAFVQAKSDKQFVETATELASKTNNDDQDNVKANRDRVISQSKNRIDRVTPFNTQYTITTKDNLTGNIVQSIDIQNAPKDSIAEAHTFAAACDFNRLSNNHLTNDLIYGNKRLHWTQHIVKYLHYQDNSIAAKSYFTLTKNDFVKIINALKDSNFELVIGNDIDKKQIKAMELRNTLNLSEKGKLFFDLAASNQAIVTSLLSYAQKYPDNCKLSSYDYLTGARIRVLDIVRNFNQNDRRYEFFQTGETMKTTHLSKISAVTSTTGSAPTRATEPVISQWEQDTNGPKAGS